MAAAAEYGSQGSATSVSSVATIAGLDFNAEASDRRIAASIAFELTATISGVTIGGVAAAQLVQAASTSRRAEIWMADVPTGTSGSVVVTISTGDTVVSVDTHSLTGADGTPTDTDSSTTGTADISITGLTIPADGVGLCCWCNGSSTGGVTWTGATESQETDAGLFQHSSAIVSTVGTNTITADGETSGQALVGVAFGPAAGGAAASRPVFSRPPRFMRRRAA